MFGKMSVQRLTFLDFPAEIRNEIYRFALWTQYNYTETYGPLGVRTRRSITTTLLRSCKQIYHEAVPIMKQNQWIHFRFQKSLVSYLGLHLPNLEIDEIAIQQTSPPDLTIELAESPGQMGDFRTIFMSPHALHIFRYTFWYLNDSHYEDTHLTFTFGQSPVRPRFLLESFTSVQGFKYVDVNGDIDQSSKLDFLRQIRRPWSLEEIVNHAQVLVDEGQTAYHGSRWREAQYKWRHVALFYEYRLQMWERGLADGRYTYRLYCDARDRTLAPLAYPLAVANFKLQDYEEATRAVKHGVAQFMTPLDLARHQICRGVARLEIDMAAAEGHNWLAEAFHTLDGRVCDTRLLLQFLNTEIWTEDFLSHSRNCEWYEHLWYFYVSTLVRADGNEVGVEV